MKKVFFKVVILAFVLVFGMTVLGCEEDDSGGGNGDWTNVTSLAQINGTWKGTISYTDTHEGITYKRELEITYIINASARTVTISQKQKTTMSGFSPEQWTLYTTGLPEGTTTETGTDEDGNPYTVTIAIDDTKRTITTTQTTPPQTQTLTNEEIAQISSYVLISKDGTKLKYLAMVGEDGEPMIFYKQ
jgi:hypothetical protein